MKLVDNEARKNVAWHLKRVKAQSEFSKKYGIITPIRAVRYVFSFHDLEKSIAEVCKMAEAASKMQTIKDMKPVATTIGYFAACRPHHDNVEFEPICYGFSACSPEDPFNEDIGILKALETKFVKSSPEQVPAADGKLITDAFPLYFSHHLHVSQLTDFTDVVVDFFPVSPLEQWNDFHSRRSVKYFKNSTVLGDILPF